MIDRIKAKQKFGDIEHYVRLIVDLNKLCKVNLLFEDLVRYRKKIPVFLKHIDKMKKEIDEMIKILEDMRQPPKYWTNLTNIWAKRPDK